MYNIKLHYSYLHGVVQQHFIDHMTIFFETIVNILIRFKVQRTIVNILIRFKGICIDSNILKINYKYRKIYQISP